MVGPTRIALIHALDESVAPSHEAFRQLWPEAFIFDLLDTSLAVDRAHAGRLDDRMKARFSALASYAAGTSGEGGDTAGILFTCSAFGPAIDAVKSSMAITVLKPNEAALNDALDCGSRLGLVVSFEPSRASLTQELLDLAAGRGVTVNVVSVMAEGALDALKSGDGARHDTLAAKAAASLGNLDAIILGQFSLARAQEEAARLSKRPIITAPKSAVMSLKRKVLGPERGPCHAPRLRTISGQDPTYSCDQ
jgi:Asp/Glu/hydantoin racemase